MTIARPRVTIGMPLYNGRRYLAHTLRSVLAQTYGDFELLVADNASTDGSAALVRGMAEHDPRIRLLTSRVNRGAAWNYNRLVAAASGEYFKWIAHDDPIRPTFLARCVSMLDAHRESVLAFAGIECIDDQGRTIARRPCSVRFDQAKPNERFGRVLAGIDFEAVFGLMRLNALRRTGLIGNYANSDIVLLAELALHGTLVQCRDPLLLSRDHAANSVRSYPDPAARAAWFDPAKASRTVFPICREASEYLRAIERSGLSIRERLRCMEQVIRWTRWNAGRMLHDIARGAGQMLGVVGRPTAQGA